MRILQGFLMIMGVLAVLAVVALVIGYVLAILTPDIRSSIRPVVLSSEAVESFKNKVDAYQEQFKTSSGSNDITLSLTEEEINSMIVMNLAEGTIPAKEILVNLNDGYLVLYIEWKFTMLPVKTGIIGSFDVEDNKPKFLLQRFFLGKLPLPSNIDQGVQQLINIYIHLNPPSGNYNITYKEISITEGKVKIVNTVERTGNSAAK